jgi:chemotaxis protein methyltransferase CheR
MAITDIKELLNFNDVKLDIQDDELSYFSRKLKELAGISLTTSKKELLKGRLRKRLYTLNLDTFADYRNYLESLPIDDHEWQDFVNLLTTNKTDFFREPKHFDFLTHHYIPQWLKQSSKEDILKIWSCAASTGEEAYSLAMHLSELLPADRKFHILSTDIDTHVIKTAKNGVYPIDRWDQIPEELRAKHTDRGTGEISHWFRIKPSLKKYVTFDQHNLIDQKKPREEKYDLIFCRNVFIYFNKETITEISSKLYQACNPHGLLFIGHSESIQNLSTRWELIKPAIYKRDIDK